MEMGPPISILVSSLIIFVKQISLSWHLRQSRYKSPMENSVEHVDRLLTMRETDQQLQETIAFVTLRDRIWHLFIFRWFVPIGLIAALVGFCLGLPSTEPMSDVLFYGSVCVILVCCIQVPVLTHIHRRRIYARYGVWADYPPILAERVKQIQAISGAPVLRSWIAAAIAATMTAGYTIYVYNEQSIDTFRLVTATLTLSVVMTLSIVMSLMTLPHMPDRAQILNRA